MLGAGGVQGGGARGLAGTDLHAKARRGETGGREGVITPESAGRMTRMGVTKHGHIFLSVSFMLGGLCMRMASAVQASAAGQRCWLLTPKCSYCSYRPITEVQFSRPSSEIY